MLSCGVLPGSSRFCPSLVAIDQLLCLPEPLMPANGFSCSRQTRPWRRATFFMVSIVSWLWSVAMLVVVKIGASSCCAGATSLCLVLAENAQLPQLVSSSYMKAAMRSLIWPK